MRYLPKKIIFFFFFIPVLIFGQDKAEEKTPSQATGQIEVKPTAQDTEIQQRLEKILRATGWFDETSIEVKEGIVFLFGKTQTEELKKWAGNLARNTQNVVAVVNKIEVIEPSPFDFSTITESLNNYWHGLVKSIPMIIVGILILIIAWVIARFAAMLARKLLKHKVQRTLLQDIISRAIGAVIFLLGIYLIFEMTHLTAAAFTIISGTGLIGIVLGIAFRDITENFLASILLSIHNPFQNGDLIEVEGFLGYVQKLTMRVTVLMSLEGNHVQIPNSTIYKSNIRNYTSNPNRREDFKVGIGYQETISEAQKVALKVLEEHEAVLKDPEPWVLVESLGKATINLRIYFWLNGSQHSWLKVKSSVIRLVKRAFQEAEISMPDEAREIICPKPISIQMLDSESSECEKPTKELPKEPQQALTDTKSGLRSEAEDIKEQAQQARPPEGGENFLNSKKLQK